MFSIIPYRKDRFQILKGQTALDKKSTWQSYYLVRKLPEFLLCLISICTCFNLSLAQVEGTPAKASRRIAATQTQILIRALAKQPKGPISIESVGLLPPPPSPSQFSPPRQLPVPNSPLLATAVETVNKEQIKQDTETDPEYVEVRDFTTQIWNVLQKGGYKPYFPSGSHVLPDEGVTIYVCNSEARVLAETLRKCLIGSGIAKVRVEEDLKDEAYLKKYVPSYHTLLKIEIGER